MTLDAAGAARRLQAAWQGRPRFVALFGGEAALGALLAAWHAWTLDPQRCGRLHLIAVMPSWPTADAVPALAPDRAAAACARRLAAAWPPPTRNVHRRAFDDGRVQLLLAAGPLAPWLRELDATVHAFELHGPGHTEAPPALDVTGIARGLARLAAAGAQLAWTDPPPALPAELQRLGFVGETAAAGRTDDGAWRARFAGRRPPRATAPASPGRIVIVGAGLAGCATAAALAEHGWSSTLVDRHPAPAQEASSNPGGLFHGTVNGDDGPHARFNRASALEAQRAVQAAITQHGVAGATEGLLRLVTAPGGWPAMQALVERHALPEAYVQALDAAAAEAAAGVRLGHPAWRFAGGGWVDPGGLARSLLARAGSAAAWLGGRPVHALRRHAGGWTLVDARGEPIIDADTVVLANAGEAAHLAAGAAWPLQSVRGQISLAARAGLETALPRLPVAGFGYLLPKVGGRVLFGATAQPGDLDPAVRASDHAYNLARLQRLLPDGLPLGAPWSPADLQGRVGWRWLTPDRLPLVGPVADLDPQRWAAGSSLGRVPRVPGLHVFSGLASRGITWAALGAQVIASYVGGMPQPLERSLRDALDPARFALRERRRAGG